MKAISLAFCLVSISAMAQTTTPMDTILKKVHAARTFFESLGKLYPRAEQVTLQKEEIAGVTCHWLAPVSPIADRIIVYLHGGSFAYGSIQSHAAMVSHLAQGLSSKILFIEYSLAPEKPFPHGVNDVVSVYQVLLKQYPKAEIIWIGDSAGGGILVTSVHELFQAKIKAPAKVVMISPWLDLRCQNPSYESKKQVDTILTQEGLKEYAGYYSPRGIDEANPSQLSFRQFPPALLLVGSDEILLDDSKHFEEYLNSIHQSVKLMEFEHQKHVWLLTDIQSEAAVRAIGALREFIQ